MKSLCKSGILLDKGKIVLQDDIDKCITRYQSNLFDKKINEDLSHYNNEFFDLTGFRLVNENGQEITQPIENNEKSFVQIEINMKKIHHSFEIGYAIYNLDGSLLYYSNLTDDYVESNNVREGNNTLTGEIPSHFLNEGEYYIYLSSSLHYIQWLVNPNEDSPCLKLNIQGGLSDSPFWTIKRPGVCAPVLKWVVKN